MKRFLCFLTVLLLLAALAVPAMAADLQGGYYFVADCALGTGLKFYVPADYSTGSLTYDSSGYLFNLTASSIYLYCPDYPDYTIYAARFSGFQYRPSSGSGYSYADLNAVNVTETNIQIYEAAPGKSLGTSEVLLILVALMVVLIGCYVILGRR